MDPRLGEMLDTPREARAAYFEMIARMTPAARARKAASLGRAARELARAGIRLQRPDASESEVERELVARLYGADVALYLAPYLSRADRG
jgi:hypothetical protein